MTYMRFMYMCVCVRNVHVYVALRMSLFVIEMCKDEMCAYLSQVHVYMCEVYI